MAFQGFLGGLQLLDILQLAAGSGRTGLFRFRRRDGAEARLYVFRGEVVHAEVDGHSGEEAVFRLAGWEEGEFEFVSGAATGRRSVARGGMTVLLEAARRLDEEGPRGG